MTDKPKYSVLTYIYNNYEIVHEVKEKDPDAEYILLTDNPALKSDTWTVVHTPLNGKTVWGKLHDIRQLPFNYVNSDVVIRLDGSIGIQKSLASLVDVFNKGNYDKCLMVHPFRDNIANELDIWVQVRGYASDTRDRCLAMIKKMGYDLSYKGLFQTCFEILRNNTINRDIGNMSLGLMRYTGGNDIDRLDQCVTSFVINHFFSDRLKVLPVSELLVKDGNLMQWYNHNSNDINPKLDMIQPMMFNLPCVPWDYIYNK